MPMAKILDQINSPQDLKKLSVRELARLAREIRVMYLMLLKIKLSGMWDISVIRIRL